MQTDFLVSRPSLCSGVARIFDFWGLYNRYNGSRTGSEADRLALRADWRAVGQDLRSATRDFKSRMAPK
jgi:hypothetical protein